MENLNIRTIFVPTLQNSVGMKNYILTTVAIATLLLGSCQPSTDSEEEAILSTLQAESDALITGDFEAFQALHVQSELETRVEMGIYGYRVYKGWDNVSALVGDFMDAGSTESLVNKKENCIVHVSGKSAWVTCDNLWMYSSAPDQILYNNLQITFLEKRSGTWKISFSAYYTKGDQSEMTIH